MFRTQGCLTLRSGAARVDGTLAGLNKCVYAPGFGLGDLHGRVSLQPVECRVVTRKPSSLCAQKMAGKLQVSSYQLNSLPLQGLLLSASLSVFEKNVNFSNAAT